MDIQRDHGGAEINPLSRPRFGFEQESDMEALQADHRENPTPVIGGRSWTRSEIQAPITWEEAAAKAMRQIVRDFDISEWARTPQQSIASLDDQLDELLKNYYNAPLYTPTMLRSRFVDIGRNVLGGWITETQDTIASHVASTLRTLAAKQSDYGHENITKFAIRGVLTRMGDKHARLENLYRKGVRNALFETIEDTWLDLLGYSTIALMLIDDVFNLPLEKDL